MDIWSKIRNRLYKACDIMELLMGIAVIAGVVVAATALVPELVTFWNNRTDAEALLIFLEGVFNIVIGIEFLKMLCKPDADTIMEVLIFLVARHMIINQTTALEDLLSIMSMGILFVIKKYINAPAKKAKLGSFFTGKYRTHHDKEKPVDIKLAASVTTGSEPSNQSEPTETK